MERKYTKGPWEIEDEYVQQIGQENLAICSILNLDEGGNKGWYRGDVTVANAQLIAAAPCLLEALVIAIEVMECVGGENDCSRGIEAAEAAIARATGEAR